MSARYLLRFDDICPTMNWKVWRKIETALLAYQIKPLLALVPDNRDPQLCVAPAHENFWDEARRWQSMGWTIGLHGYQHLYVTDNAGLLGLNARSEFAGLSAFEQQEKLQNALAVFQREHVTPEIWIAPGHSFDENTVAALRKFGVHSVSDGFFLYPHCDTNGMFWLPQQLWRFRKMPFGVWTICFHHNHWQAVDVARFTRMIEERRAEFTCVAEMRAQHGHRRIARYDRAASKVWRAALQFKRALQRRE